MTDRSADIAHFLVAQANIGPMPGQSRQHHIELTSTLLFSAFDGCTQEEFERGFDLAIELLQMDQAADEAGVL